MIKGSCHCEAVQFTVDAVEPVGVNCYCTICRKISGGPYAPVVMVQKGAFHLSQGEDLLSKYNATPGFDRWHCSVCHSPVYGDAPSLPNLPIFVPAGAFDGADIAHVTFEHMFVRSLVPWHKITDGEKQYETYPE